MPTPTEPAAPTTKGVASGFVESSTTKALPVPSCVMRTISEDVVPEKIPPTPVEVGTTFSVLLNVETPDTLNCLVNNVAPVTVVMPANVDSPVTFN